jgi:LysW-gamma-L-lysine carboxypeptidase
MTTALEPTTEQAAIALLRDLVATPSVSGDEHAAVLLLVQRMEAMGLRTHIDEAGNAVGIVGSDGPDAAEVLLLGHIDTVAGQIPVRVEDGVLWGRGSVDAKGPLCAFVAAAATADLPANMRVVVVGAVGEETPTSPGATLVRDRYRPHACIIGEPSGWDRFCIGYKGRLLVHATFVQDCGHTAGPVGSVAERALGWHRRVVAHIQEWNLGREGVFDTIQPSLQRFNTSSDGLEDAAHLTLGLRLPTWIEPDELERHLRQIRCDGALRFEGHAPAHRGTRSDALAGAISCAIGSLGGRPTATVKTGTSDMNTVARALSCPILAYGPGDSTLDHTPNERLDLVEYLRSIGVLRLALPELALDLSSPSETPAPSAASCPRRPL